MRIVTDALPAGRVGESYSARLEADCGDPSALIWEIANGGFPPLDLSLGKDGILSGIPKRAENADFEFAVHNQSTGERASRVLRLAVLPKRPEELKIADDSVPDAAAGAPYSFTLGCSGGIPPYEWSIDGLPDGLSFENGTISGTAKYSGGRAPFTVRVRDAGGSAAMRFCLINVK